jgi:hypothetical protein
MTITGTLKHVFDTQTVSDKFKKREFILTTESNTPYPQHISFQLNQDKVALTDNIETGQEMIVHFNLRGREWNGPQGLKYFNTLEAWKVEAVGAAPVAPIEDDGLPY